MVGNKERELMGEVRKALLFLKSVGSFTPTEEKQMLKVVTEFRKLDNMMFR